MDITTEVALLNERQASMKDTVERLEETLENFIEKSDERYVMRKEFLLAISIIGTISGIVMPIVVFLLSKLRG